MSFWRKLVQKFTPQKGETVDWEALLLEADLGLPLTQKLAQQILDRGWERDFEKGQAWVKSQLISLVQTPPPLPVSEKPEVILLLGVNGSGKTTTAAKLAHLAQKRGRTVFFGAADTFRAAAVEQLQLWGERLKIPVIASQAGADPASVAFQSLESAQKEKADLLIIDTAGRQANKNNLMLELAKIKRTLQKKMASAPHHAWLVVDANTGNNILSQAKEFHTAVGLTGLIMTKVDGSGKGGMVAAVREEIGLPTFYLGRGEKLDDLELINPKKYVEEFFGE